MCAYQTVCALGTCIAAQCAQDTCQWQHTACSADKLRGCAAQLNTCLQCHQTVVLYHFPLRDCSNTERFRGCTCVPSRLYCSFSALPSSARSSEGDPKSSHTNFPSRFLLYFATCLLRMALKIFTMCLVSLITGFTG